MVRGTGREEKEKKGRRGTGKMEKVMERLTRMCSWNRAAGWLRPALVILTALLPRTLKA